MVTNAIVINVVLAPVEGGVRAVGVLVSRQDTGETVVVLAAKEVILSAGTFQTPQLLMVSVRCLSKL